MPKIFKDGLQTSPNNNSMGESAAFSKFPVGWGRRGKTVTLRFGDVIICLIMSALKNSLTNSLSVTNRPQQIHGYFCLIS